jgi:hypothetical protein
MTKKKSFFPVFAGAGKVSEQADSPRVHVQGVLPTRSHERGRTRPRFSVHRDVEGEAL